MVLVDIPIDVVQFAFGQNSRALMIFTGGSRAAARISADADLPVSLACTCLAELPNFREDVQILKIVVRSLHHHRNSR